jgi:hypothetical protein
VHDETINVSKINKVCYYLMVPSPPIVCTKDVPPRCLGCGKSLRLCD